MKKVLALLMVLALSVGLAATAFADGPVSVGGVTGKVGDTVEVTVSATAAKAFRSSTVYVLYDAAKLTLSSVAASSTLGGMNVNEVTEASQVEGVTAMFAWNTGTDEVDGTYAIIAYANAETVQADGAIFTLTFVLNEEGTHPVKAVVTMSDAANADVLDQVEGSGNVTVTGSHLAGDMNGDGRLTIRDVNLLMRLVRDGEWDATGDMNNSGDLTIRDVNFLMRAVRDWVDED